MEEVIHNPELEQARIQQNDKREKKLTEDIVKSLESIGELANQHLSVKGLGGGGGQTDVAENKPTDLTNKKEEEKIIKKKEIKEVETVEEEKSWYGQVRMETSERRITSYSTNNTSSYETKEVSSFKKESEKDPSASYASLGVQFKGLTEGMKDVMSDMNDSMPFIDEDANAGSSSNSNNAEEERKVSNDSADLDRAILEATGLSEEAKVESIQVDAASPPVDSTASTLVVEDKQGQVEIKREFSDV